MEALRLIKSPKKGKITITLPDDLKTEERLEVIILPAGEGKKITKGFEPRQFKGAAKLDMSIKEIDRECQKMRDEWKRGF